MRALPVVVCSLLVLACGGEPPTTSAVAVGPRLHRVRAARETAAALLRAGAVPLADYDAFQVLDAPSAALEAVAGGAAVELRDDDRTIHLNAGDLDTASPQGAALAAAPAAGPAGSGPRLVQFVGPIQPEWRARLEAGGLRVIGYVPNNAYLVHDPGTAAAEAALGALAGRIQFQAPYVAALKIARSAAERGAGVYAIQLVEDGAQNPETLALVDSLTGAPPRVDRALGFVNVVVAAGPDAVAAIARRPDVISIHGWSTPRLLDERQDMIVAGALQGAAPAGPGYLDWLAARGFTQEQFDAAGFGVDVTDSGVDNGTPLPGHFGLYRLGEVAAASRIAYSRIAGTPHVNGTPAGCDGHGTLNAHIIGGYSSASGAPFADGSGFRYGLGVAPFVRLGASVIFDPWFTDPRFEDLQSQAYADGMRISNDSWGEDAGAGEYDALCQRFDALVRDAQPTGSASPTPGNQEMVIVFAAGNDGPWGRVNCPGAAKNVIAVGASEGVQAFGGNDGSGIGDELADGALDVADFSSRGPVMDGRTRPDLMAPGTHVSGGVPQAEWQRAVPPAQPLGAALSCFDGSGVSGGVDSKLFPPGQEWYTASSGTSHAAPAVAGAAALLRQWFLNHGRPAPSPAMTKAYLLDAARYMTGTDAGDALFSNAQGMGLLDLSAALDETPRLLRDQIPEDTFTRSGQQRVFTGVAEGPGPLRITLAWTDAPGSTAGAAYVNDLDLRVEVGGEVYLGNVFSGPTSTTGGSADRRNNVESVFLPPGVTGAYTVTVTAANVAADGVPQVGPSLDQDFALVVTGATGAPSQPRRRSSSSGCGTGGAWPGLGAALALLPLAAARRRRWRACSPAER